MLPAEMEGALKHSFKGGLRLRMHILKLSFLTLGLISNFFSIQMLHKSVYFIS